jgi:hypothetical protein
MNPWPNEMKPVHAVSIVDLFGFVCKVEKVTVTIKKIQVRCVILLHHTQSPGETTKICPIQLRKDTIE